MKKTVVVISVCFLSVCGPTAFAQDGSDLNARLSKVEAYVESFQPTLMKFSDSFQKSIQQYTQQLEQSLTEYSQRLQENLDERVQKIENRIVVLDPFSRGFQRLDTNAGVFLLSVEKVEKIETGTRVHLNIGNLNAADYKDFTLRLVWGPAQNAKNYEQWRSALTGAEFSFQGALKRGEWNKAAVDLSGNIEYLECSMSIESVELSTK